MWKLLRRILPFPDILEHFGFCMPSFCPFCIAASASLEHCLFHCSAAHQVWTYFGRVFGLALNNAHSIRAACHAWWISASPGSSPESILLPCLLLWFLWVTYNDCIFNGATFSPSGVIMRIKHESYLISLANPPYRKNDLAACFLSEGMVARFAAPPRRTTIWVKWLAPPSGRLKLNSDAVFTSAGAAGGAILRDSRGLCIAGLYFRLEATSVLEAETLALRKAVQWCEAMALRPSAIEVDALDLARLVTSPEARSPWKIGDSILYIRSSLLSWGSMLTHVYREANQVAYALAVEGLVASSPAVVCSFLTLPVKAKLALLYDFGGFATCGAIRL
ncbi:PREDICTED: uncharacterized protein LOC109158796 [Ipomoea nil]|uniref:uncharacterized protein LOC109158796 n=1 Tax=Ipomoea nil TaxID=35883 RepID=UPI000901BA83|nr:PREDICTED: uncharacterized protein LOC109158796 [Ipomoea nil]